VALAAVLNFIPPLYTFPQGGRISLVMVPLIFLAFYRGVGPAVIAGIVYSPIAYISEPFFVHPAQLILDYPVAFGSVGLAGVFGAGGPLRVAVGTLLGGGARFLAHFVSGIVFFAAFAPEGQPVWLYSLIYNGTYMLPSTLVAIPVVYGLLRGFESAGIE
jgi:thiamine transporter